VWEWCQDWYAFSYPAGPQIDPLGPASGDDRVIRGGGWILIARYCRSAYRGRYTPIIRDIMGLRLARTTLSYP
jgi:formylglycine-generating enzyme required for sulfatase activity